MELDLAELGVSVACVAEVRYKHPLQDRVDTSVILVGLLQSLGLNSQVQQRRENACKNPVLSGCSIVSGEWLYLTIIEG